MFGAIEMMYVLRNKCCRLKYMPALTNSTYMFNSVRVHNSMCKHTPLSVDTYLSLLQQHSEILIYINSQGQGSSPLGCNSVNSATLCMLACISCSISLCGKGPALDHLINPSVFIVLRVLGLYSCKTQTHFSTHVMLRSRYLPPNLTEAAFLRPPASRQPGFPLGCPSPCYTASLVV